MMIRGLEQLHRVCRDREREIQKLVNLSEVEFQRFRQDLAPLYDLFTRYVKDKTRCLDATELEYMLRETGLAPKNQSEKDDYNKIIKEVDKNRNRLFDFGEFL